MNLSSTVTGGGGTSEKLSPASTSTSTGSRPAEYSKLVRGQDVWLSGGGERTRRSILRCIQCGESFRSLPELTVHMVHTRHYTNIVGATGTSTSSPSATSTSGHVTAAEHPAARKQHQQQSTATKTSHRKSPPVTSRGDSVRATSPPGNPMTSSWSPGGQAVDLDVSRRTTAREISEHDVSTPHRSPAIHSPASLPETETGRQLAGTRLLYFKAVLAFLGIHLDLYYNYN